MPNPREQCRLSYGDGEMDMTKSSRFFEIIQMLRGAKRPLLARDMAEQLEVSVRTIYRDIATLQAMQTPIYGEAGIGYEMRRGYDLPPLNFDLDEAEALSVGLSLVARTGDIGLWKAAERAARKLVEAAPGTRQLVTSSWGVDTPVNVDFALLRKAIRDESKLAIEYQDESGNASTRVVWPLVIIYYVDAAMLVAWCELRAAIRHFRVDRFCSCTLHTEHFAGRGAQLISEWEQRQKEQMVFSRQGFSSG